jgi:trk system potassium uptake protein TrkH
MSFEKKLNPLIYAVRIRVVAKYLGQLLIAVGIVSIVPLSVSLVYSEYLSSIRYFIVVLGTLSVGAAMSRMRGVERVENNEALVISALVFLAVPLIMVYPVMSYDIGFTDALFETVSAITTTGLTTVGVIEGSGDSFLFSRAWMQWYGGLGIVVLSVALLVGPGSAARRLARIGGERESLISGTRVHAQRVLSVYVTLTVIGIMALWMTGLDWRTSLLHALAGVSTGGFSTFDDNMAGFGNWISQAVLMILALAGAISLALYHPAYYRAWRELTGHLELKGIVATSLVVIGLLAFCMLMSDYEALRILEHAPLMALSAQTGAGFSSLSVESLDPASKLVLIVSMFIGGGVGSTAGGIKILRLLILLRLLQLLIQRACMPAHAVVEPTLADHQLAGREIEHALLIILWFVVVIVLSWLLFLIHGYSPLDSLFDVVSATGTVGLSSGVTSPDLPFLLKAVLCLDMLLGRLEVVALLLVLYPRTWIGRRLD